MRILDPSKILDMKRSIPMRPVSNIKSMATNVSPLTVTSASIYDINRRYSKPLYISYPRFSPAQINKRLSLTSFVRLSLLKRKEVQYPLPGIANAPCFCFMSQPRTSHFPSSELSYFHT